MSTHTSLGDLFQDTADQIKIKLGYASDSKIKADNFPALISSISTGGTPVSGTTTITTDGNYDVSSYASAVINVKGSLTTVSINETIAASNTAQTLTRVPTSTEYITGVTVTVPSVSLSGAQTAILSGQSVQLISNGVAIQTLQGTNTAIIPSGTTNITTNGTQHAVGTYLYANVSVVPATATANIYNVSNDSQYALGGFYNFLNIKGASYYGPTIGSNNGTVYIKTCWQSTGGDRNYTQYTVPSNFYAKYIIFLGISRRTKGIIDFTTGYIHHYVDDSALVYHFTDPLDAGGWLDQYADYDITKRQLNPGSKVNLPLDGSSTTVYIICLGSYYNGG